MRNKEREMLEKEIELLWIDLADVLQDERYKQGYQDAIRHAIILIMQFGRETKNETD